MISIRKIIYRVLGALLLAAAIVYVVDFAVFRIRMIHPEPGDPLETITATRLLAIDEKGGKTEFTIDQIQPQQTGTCAHTLFPQGGYPPCWYLKRKFSQPIPMSVFFIPSKPL